MSKTKNATPETVALVLTDQIREYLAARAAKEDRSMSAVARRIMEAEMNRAPVSENGHPRRG